MCACVHAYLVSIHTVYKKVHIYGKKVICICICRHVCVFLIVFILSSYVYEIDKEQKLPISS